MLYIPVQDLAAFDSLQGQEQRSRLLAAGWFCCAWSRAYWPPDTHHTKPTTNAAAVQALRTQLGIGQVTKD